MALLLVGGAIAYSLYARKSLQSQVAVEENLLSAIPQASFTGLGGEVVPMGMSAYAPGTEAVLVHFWATWCGPCEAELPELVRFLGKLPGKDKLRVLLVAVNDELPKVRKFVATLPIPDGVRIEWVMDSTHAHRDAYGTMKLPETHVFGRQGRFLRKLVGPQEWGKPLFFDMFGAWLP